MQFNYKKYFKYSLCTNSQSLQQFELLFENLQLFMHTHTKCSSQSPDLFSRA